jgi:hypothetical protein
MTNVALVCLDGVSIIFPIISLFRRATRNSARLLIIILHSHLATKISRDTVSINLLR